jgi:hypothetical protein
MKFLSRLRQEADDRRRRRIRNEEIASWLVFGVILVVGLFLFRQAEPLIARVMPFLFPPAGGP